MSQQPSEDLPRDEHLREDVGVPAPKQESAAEFDEDAFTSGQLNAGQRVPGLSPEGEYKASENPERAAEPGQDGFLPPEPAPRD
ncbi:hypothetical protein [Arthrobacter sp. Marseille-P9274]|uniref:hypothetical protein n=1 Tax=Arthrobacter sp. Marseille-P9274 TaxID=2866572 RepID=UPI0021C7C67B|nr:hypothetical protein [Arthrobacter sp. Marseille-P9274]